VKISLVDIQENFIVMFSRLRIVVRDVLKGFLLLDFLKQFFPMKKYCFVLDVRLCVSKGWGLNEGLLGGCLDDGQWLWREFLLPCDCWGGTFSHL
jgi:hypothetical protein